MAFVCLKSFRPIPRLASMMSDSEHLNLPIDFAIYKVEMENLKHRATNVGCQNYAKSRRCSADHGH